MIPWYKLLKSITFIFSKVPYFCRIPVFSDKMFFWWLKVIVFLTATREINGQGNISFY